MQDISNQKKLIRVIVMKKKTQAHLYYSINTTIIVQEHLM